MNRGFTFVEVIAVLLLSALLVGAFTAALIPATEGLTLVRRNTEAAQKAQFAMTRMVREMAGLTNVVSGSGTSITYDFLDPDGNDRRSTLAWDGPGQPLTVNNLPLSDDVALFALRYYTNPDAAPASAWNNTMRQVEIVLQSAAAGSMIYSNRLAFR
jgi:prepilin-type N-terminal cleavage/methylation domain-containing protein